MQIPHVTIPVRPGRDIARLIEVAAMDQKLKALGQNSAAEFNMKLLGQNGTRVRDGITQSKRGGSAESTKKSRRRSRS